MKVMFKKICKFQKYKKFGLALFRSLQPWNRIFRKKFQFIPNRCLCFKIWNISFIIWGLTKLKDKCRIKQTKQSIQCCNKSFPTFSFLDSLLAHFLKSLLLYFNLNNYSETYLGWDLHLTYLWIAYVWFYAHWNKAINKIQWKTNTKINFSKSNTLSSGWNQNTFNQIFSFLNHFQGIIKTYKILNKLLE